MSEDDSGMHVDRASYTLRDICHLLVPSVSSCLICEVHHQYVCITLIQENEEKTKRYGV